MRLTTLPPIPSQPSKSILYNTIYVYRDNSGTSRFTLRDLAYMIKYQSWDLPAWPELNEIYKKRGLIIHNGYVISLERYIERYVAEKICNKEFQRIPNNIPEYFGSGVHISTQDPSLFAIYPNNHAILAHRAVKIRPGRYLKKYFEHFSDNRIRQLVGTITTDVSLKILHTFDEIYEAYTQLAKNRIVKSCMSGDGWDDNLDKHPLQVYHNSDVGLAVMVNKKTGKYLARALVNLNTKQYPIIYGYWERMEPLLKQYGYTHGSLDGATINYIKHGFNLVMPYIDGYRPHTREQYSVAQICVDHGGKTATIVDFGGDYYCGDTDGYIDLDTCGCCGKLLGNSDDEYCASCHEEYDVEVIIDSRRNTDTMFNPDTSNFVYIDNEDYPIIDNYVTEQLGYRYVESENTWYPEDDVLYNDEYYPAEDWERDEDSGEWQRK